MEKPTIFFSHSSIDKDYISCLHKKVSATTAKTVEVFQSSDGESIPFGNNWVHKIEENLHKAKVMFVFVSPESLSSSWIYFESGFAYAKNVKVIPIGIKGVDIGKLKPPLNLLQGFNINSEHGMNNIITVLNREFHCEFLEAYDESDFKELSSFDESYSSNDFKLLEKINYFNFSFPSEFKISKKSETILICDNPLDVILTKLSELGIQSSLGNNYGTLYSHGLIANSIFSGKVSVRIKVDPFMLSTYLEFFNTIADELYGTGNLKRNWCNIIFNEDVILETVDIKISSRLYSAGIQQLASQGGYFKFEDVDFTIESNKDNRANYREVAEDNLRVIFDQGQLDINTIMNLVSCLIDAKVIQ